MSNAVSPISTSRAVSLSDAGHDDRSHAPQSVAARGGAQPEVQATLSAQESAAPISADASAQRQATSALTDLLPSGGFHPAAGGVAAKESAKERAAAWCQGQLDVEAEASDLQAAKNAVVSWIHRTWN